MAVKFPLEMKDGVQVRNISELKENFDVEKIVGYFLNGKLKKWLDARWYEDESEAISKLNESDPLLAQCLCEIFGVEYEAEEINPEKIVTRNARISKLKQYTDDEEIIKNVDAVAFDQEELADLYEKGIEKIYLCEGKFKVPKSKKDLIYELIGNVVVEGIVHKAIQVEKTYDMEADMNNYGLRMESSITQELGDVIGERNHAESDNFVVWILPNVRSYEYNLLDEELFRKKNGLLFRENRIRVWDKVKDEYYSINAELGSDAATEIEFVGEKLVVRNGGMQVYEIINKELKCIYERKHIRGDFSVNNQRIAFRPLEDSDVSLFSNTFGNTNRSIIVLDISTMKEINTGVVPEDYNMFEPSEFWLMDKQLCFVKNNSIYMCDVENNNAIEKLFSQSQLERPMMVGYADEMFLRYNNTRTDEGKVIGFKSGDLREYINGVGIYDRCYIAEKLGLLILKKYNGIYILDMNLRICDFLPIEYKTCDVVSIVGNYLYYRTDHDKLPTHRIDLRNYKEGSVRIKRGE